MSVSQRRQPGYFVFRIGHGETTEFTQAQHYGKGQSWGQESDYHGKPADNSPLEWSKVERAHDRGGTRESREHPGEWWTYRIAFSMNCYLNHSPGTPFVSSIGMLKSLAICNSGGIWTLHDFGFPSSIYRLVSFSTNPTKILFDMLL